MTSPPRSPGAFRLAPPPGAATHAALLQVDGLNVSYGGAAGLVPVVRDVSFTLGGEKLALVGESGSGKSTVGRALLRLLPAHAQVSARCLRFEGVDLLAASPAEMTRLRGRRLSMIMQDPKYSLNPVMSVGAQIAEAVQRAALPGAGPGGGAVGPAAPHGRAAVAERVEQLMQTVRIREPGHVARQYPHQLSGGMGQRVMIAMMLAQNPRLLIADEPTSALDVSVRREVLDLLDELVAKQGLSLLFITHDLPLVGRFCDRVMVMFAGRAVETLAAADLAQAQHPYTRALLHAVPSLRQRRASLPVMVRDPAWSQP